MRISSRCDPQNLLWISLHTDDPLGMVSVRGDVIAGHWHHGEGTGASRKESEAKAIRMWVDFTGSDYGTDWMSYQRAESKTSNCERSGAEWKCSVDARACKLTRR